MAVICCYYFLHFWHSDIAVICCHYCLAFWHSDIAVICCHYCLAFWHSDMAVICCHFCLHFDIPIWLLSAVTIFCILAFRYGCYLLSLFFCILAFRYDCYLLSLFFCIWHLDMAVICYHCFLHFGIPIWLLSAVTILVTADNSHIGMPKCKKKKKIKMQGTF